MFNFCAFCGKVCDDPALSFSKKDRPIITFNLAIKVLDNEVGWIKVACIGRLAALTAKYLRQGDRVAMVGFLTMTNWQTDDGTWCSDAEVIAMDLEMVKGEGHTWG